MNSIAALLLTASLLFVGLRALWLRERREAIFARHAEDSPTLSELRDVLAVINSECTTYVFSALRRANIAFQDRALALVYGSVGSIVPHGRANSLGTKKCVFAIVPNEEKDWLLAHPDTFSPAFIGTRFSVFWTSLSKL